MRPATHLTMIINGVENISVENIEIALAEHEESLEGLKRATLGVAEHVLGENADPRIVRHWFEPMRWTEGKIRELREIALKKWKARLAASLVEVEIPQLPHAWDPYSYVSLETRQARMRKRIKELEEALDTAAKEDAEVAIRKVWENDSPNPETGRGAATEY